MLTTKRIILTTLVGLIALAAFRLSFDAQLLTVLKLAHITADIAWLYPLLVDAFIVTAYLSAAWGRQTTWWLRAYPWFAMGLFSAISVAGNDVHVVDEHVPNPYLAIAIYSVPPIALLLVTHLAVTTVFRDAPARVQPVRRARMVQTSMTTPVAAGRRSTPRSDIPPVTSAELVAMSDKDMSMREIADVVGRSKAWVGKNIKDERDRRSRDTPKLPSVNARDA